jgi:putative membrane protein
MGNIMLTRMMLFASLGLLASMANAQEPNPAGTAPGAKQSAPGVPAPGQTNLQDELFARLAAVAGKSEVELGLMAKNKAKHSAVRAFAAKMANAHSAANIRLESVAKQVGIALPEGPDTEQEQIRERLEKAEGAAFDEQYIQSQVAAHIKAAQLMAWETGSGQDKGMTDFASESLPEILDHLESAQSILLELRS